MEQELIKVIESAIENTHNWNRTNDKNMRELFTKCDDNVFSITGMSGKNTRIIYNNICNNVNNWYLKYKNKPINYLEIGAHRGSSTIAALYKNSNVNATIIDNWSEFGNCQAELQDNLKKYAPENNIQLINENSFELTTELMYKPYQLYLYDGCHKTHSHKKGITDFVKYLDDLSVVLVDDYSWAQVKTGTLNGLDEIKTTHELIYTHIIEDDNNKVGFWNGLGIFILKKK